MQKHPTVRVPARVTQTVQQISDGGIPVGPCQTGYNYLNLSASQHDRCRLWAAFESDPDGETVHISEVVTRAVDRYAGALIVRGTGPEPRTSRLETLDRILQAAVPDLRGMLTAADPISLDEACHNHPAWPEVEKVLAQGR